MPGINRVLLVEDDPVSLLILEQTLISDGYLVEKAETFQAADALLASCDYDLIVTDSLLPDGNGVVLADRAAAKGVPALIVTGYLLGLTQAYPGTDFAKYTILHKPVVSAEVLKAVAWLLLVPDRNKGQRQRVVDLGDAGHRQSVARSPAAGK